MAVYAAECIGKREPTFSVDGIGNMHLYGSQYESTFLLLWLNTITKETYEREYLTLGLMALVRVCIYQGRGMAAGGPT